MSATRRLGGIWNTGAVGIRSLRCSFTWNARDDFMYWQAGLRFSRIMLQLNVQTSAQLISYAVKHGITSV